MVAILILIFLLVASLQARAAETTPTAGAAGAAAAAVAEALPGWLQLAGNLTVAGILWFYSRQFYTAMERKDAQLLELTKGNAQIAANAIHVAENYERLVRDMVPDARSSSGRISHSG